MCNIGLLSLILACFLVMSGCRRAPQMEAYPPLTDLNFTHMRDLPQVILVGRILSCSRIGSPRLSIWFEDIRYQQCRAKIVVESVIRGTSIPKTTDIYFLVDTSSGGRARLGTIDTGGTWQVGDRELFFLQRDSGRLRTVCDTFAHCVVPVFSGFHASLPPRQNVGEVMADLLFTRGQGASDAQMIKAMDKASWIGFAFAPEFSMRKLEELVQTETPPVRQEACKNLLLESQAYDRPEFTKTLPHDPKFIRAMEACQEITFNQHNSESYDDKLIRKSAGCTFVHFENGPTYINGITGC